MKRITLLTGLLAGAMTLQAAPREPQQMTANLQKGAVVVTNGKARFTFRADFRLFRTDKDPKMELRTLPDCRFFAPSWMADNLAPEKTIAQIKQSKSMGGDGIDESVSGSVKGRTFDLFATAPFTDLTPSKAEMTGDTIRFSYPATAWGTLECHVWDIDGSAPGMEVRFTPARKGYYSVGYLGAPAFDLNRVEALWQPMVWQRRIFPSQSYMSLAFTCPIPATLVHVGGATAGVAADSREMPFQPLPTRDNNRFGVALHNPEGKVQPMLFAPVLGHVGSKMEPGESFAFRMRLWVEEKPLNIAFQTMARNLYDFHDYRSNAISTLNNTIDNIIDYTLSHYSNFIDSLKGCSYSTDVPGSTKNVSSLNPLSVALVADDEELFRRRAYPIVEYMLSRKNTLFCLDTTQKVQSPSRELAGPCAPVSELAGLYRLSGGKSPVLRYFAEEKYYKYKPVEKRIPGAGGNWYDALEMYRATGETAYLDHAKKQADIYIEKFIHTQPEKFQNAFFWNRYAPFYINLLELYEETGERRYLEAAHEGAREYAMFVWMVPSIPQENVTVNQGGLAPWYWYLKSRGIPRQHCPEESVPAWRLSEIGLVPESSTTCIGHRAVFMAHHAPYMLRIADLTGDSFLRDIARSAIVGRYANFPGYHINTARTTAYEKPDFPLRPHDSISVNSFHYNHQFPLLSVLYDYLVTDAASKSQGAIAFRGDYIEGYGYLQAKFYGSRPGRFYGRENVWLWMPRHLLSSSDVELNYLAARSNGELLVAFTNQSPRTVSSVITFNPELLPMLAGKSFTAEVWRDNRRTGEVTVTDGKADIEVSPEGITALIVRGVDIRPRFQQQLTDHDTEGWRHDYGELEFGRARAMLLNLGRKLKTCYIYLQDDDSRFRNVSMTYSIDGGRPQALNDTAYPFEFTAPVPSEARQIVIELSGITTDGQLVRSGTFKLSKD